MNMRKVHFPQKRDRQSEEKRLNAFQCRRSCFSYGTPIATPEGMKAIEKIEVGDEVLVGTARFQGNELQLSWSPKPVVFSSGTGLEGRQLMVYLQCGAGQEYIVTVEHLFLMPSGELKRADHLVPNEDQLVLAEGGTMSIRALAVRAYKGGVHHIAADMSFDDKIDGHLLNANGVVSADYTLQIHPPEPELGSGPIVRGCRSAHLARLLGLIQRLMNRLRT